MTTFHLIFNHTLTERQENEARERWGIERVLYPPSEIRSVWGGIPPDLEIEEVDAYLVPVWRYLAEKISPGDPVLVQGDPGAVCLAIGRLRKLGAMPVYATTRRVVREVRIGERVEKRSVFEHVRFRKYPKGALS